MAGGDFQPQLVGGDLDGGVEGHGQGDGGVVGDGGGGDFDPLAVAAEEQAEGADRVFGSVARIQVHARERVAAA